MSSRSLNKVMLIGNLTRDPELRYIPNGSAVCSFGIATNRSWKDANGETQEEAEFHNIVAWGKMAEICNQILAKGMMVYIEGSLNTRSWEDDSGATRHKTEIRVNDMKLLDSKGKTGVGSAGKTAEGQPKAGKSPEELLDEVTSEKPIDTESDSEKAEKVKKAKKKDDSDEENEESVDEDPLNDVPF